MAGEIWNGDGLQWQMLISRLLRRKYGNDYQEIPDRDEGDCGLEGFTRSDYTAYQCYAAVEPISTSDLYEKQRDKITTDINKFVDNRLKLEKIFHNFQVEFWMLVVPRFESHKLLMHASKKAEYVREQNLPYVASNFSINVCTAEQWELERGQLLSNDLDILEISDVHSGPVTLGNTKLIDNLRRKLGNLEISDEEAARLEMKMLKFYLDCEVKLSVLNKQYPEYLERYNKGKSDKESYLEYESIMHGGTNNQLLDQTLKELNHMLTKELTGVSETTVKALSFGTLSSWLIECPLDFK